MGLEPPEQDEKAAAKAEVARLRALSPAELAAEVMPVFSRDGPAVRKIWWGGRGIEVLQICDWLMRDHRRRGYRARPRLRKAVTRGLHALEDAGLIENAQRWTQVGALAATLRPTALGTTALVEGTVRAHLNLTAR
jgi:hypothetical protein